MNIIYYVKQKEKETRRKYTITLIFQKWILFSFANTRRGRSMGWATAEWAVIIRPILSYLGARARLCQGKKYKCRSGLKRSARAQGRLLPIEWRQRSSGWDCTDPYNIDKIEYVRSSIRGRGGITKVENRISRSGNLWVR